MPTLNIEPYLLVVQSIHIKYVSARNISYTNRLRYAVHVYNSFIRDSQNSLLVFQNHWMKDMMKKFGDVSLMDATYNIVMYDVCL